MFGVDYECGAHVVLLWFPRCTGKKSKEEAERNAIEEEALTKIVVELEAGRGARNASLTSDELLLVKNLGLLTLKPLIYAANVGEDDLGNHGANNTHVQVSYSSHLSSHMLHARVKLQSVGCCMS